MREAKLAACAAGCGMVTQWVGDRLCGGCLQGLLVALRKIPDLLADLEDVVTRSARSTAAGPRIHRASTTAKDRPLPFDEKASNLRWLVENELVSWARDCAEQFPHRSMDATTPAEAASWLVSLGALLAEHPAAEEIHATFVSFVETLERTVDRQAQRQYIGLCRAQVASAGGEAGECGTKLHSSREEGDVACPGCGASYDIASSLRARADDLEARHATAAQLLEDQRWTAVPVSRSKLYQLLRWLVPVGKAEDGSNMYSILDVTTVATLHHSENRVA